MFLLRFQAASTTGPLPHPLSSSNPPSTNFPTCVSSYLKIATVQCAPPLPSPCSPPPSRPHDMRTHTRVTLFNVLDHPKLPSALTIDFDAEDNHELGGSV